MELSIITVTYNNEKTIDEYLKSTAESISEDSELIIVDNNSSDRTCQKILEFKALNEKKKIKLIECAENSGFSVANNIGANIASNSYLVFLNPDTKLYKNTLEILYEFISKNEKVGIVVPAIFTMNGKIQPSVRNLPTLNRAIGEYVFGKENLYSEYAPKTGGNIEVESAYGTCMMIKKNTFERVGGFNEKYFLYYEDLDLCRSIKKVGLKVYYIPGARISHVLGGSEDEVKTGNGGFLSELTPLEKTGRKYYQIKSANIFHGFLIGLLIRLSIFISQKLGKK